MGKLEDKLKPFQALDDEAKAKLVFKAMKRPQRRWSYPSSSNRDKKYEVLWHDDGKITCNCRGWTFMRGGHRKCSHIQDAAYHEHLELYWNDVGESFAKELK